MHQCLFHSGFSSIVMNVVCVICRMCDVYKYIPTMLAFKNVLTARCVVYPFRFIFQLNVIIFQDIFVDSLDLVTIELRSFWIW